MKLERITAESFKKAANASSFIKIFINEVKLKTPNLTNYFHSKRMEIVS